MHANRCLLTSLCQTTASQRSNGRPPLTRGPWASYPSRPSINVLDTYSRLRSPVRNVAVVGNDCQSSDDRPPAYHRDPCAQHQLTPHVVRWVFGNRSERLPETRRPTTCHSWALDSSPVSPLDPFYSNSARAWGRPLEVWQTVETAT